MPTTPLARPPGSVPHPPTARSAPALARATAAGRAILRAQARERAMPRR